MFKKIVLLSCAFLIFIGCSKKLTVPGFIKIKTENDSLRVMAINRLECPIYVKIVDKKAKTSTYHNLDAKQTLELQQFPTSQIDSSILLKTYKYTGHYGKYPFNSYDVNYNYTFPFKKGYKSNIIQGYNGDFSHYGDFSTYTLDFDMKIGDTIVAARDGIVVRAIVKHDKQGVTEDYKGYGNYIMIYHKDNTFSQYVHLRQYGNLVRVGDSVKANQPIALSGFTGWTTVPHLHFGVYKPTEKGFVSIPVTLDSVKGKSLKRGDVIIKN